MRDGLVRAVAALLVSAFAVAGLSACDAGTGGDRIAVSLPRPPVDDAARQLLPADVRRSGRLTVVMPGTNQPWWHKDGRDYTGVAAVLVDQVAAVLGLTVDHVAIPDLASAFASVSSKRYDAGFNPYGDTGSANVDVVDVVKEIVPFLVPAGNPKRIGTMESLCGRHIAATGPAGKGSAYFILQQQTTKCVAAGRRAIDIVAITGVPAGVLAVKSGRADAYFSSGAPLFYYADHSDGSLEVVGTDTDTGFSNLYQGMIVPKGSPLAEPLLQAFQKVFASGAYAKLMKAARLDREMLDAPGINLAAKT